MCKVWTLYTWRSMENLSRCFDHNYLLWLGKGRVALSHEKILKSALPVFSSVGVALSSSIPCVFISFFDMIANPAFIISPFTPIGTRIYLHTQQTSQFLSFISMAGWTCFSLPPSMCVGAFLYDILNLSLLWNVRFRFDFNSPPPSS